MRSLHINPDTGLPRCDENINPASIDNPGMRVVTLGTAGGPRYWKKNIRDRYGISTAVVVDDRFYLVDAGSGTGRRIRQSGLDYKQLAGFFMTHMHSDHTVDLPGLLVFGLYEFDTDRDTPLPLYGPGDRGALPPVSPLATTPPRPVAPENPTPGIEDMLDSLFAAYATDLNDRVLDSLRVSPTDVFKGHDIEIPEETGYHPNDNPTPDMEPFVIFQDDKVTVSAILVEHPPIAPAFAFRFDSKYGSVTISGDTTETPNMVRLAKGTDLLLHEAIDFGWVEELYAHDDRPKAQASRQHHYKSHTSVEGAVRIAQEAGAKRLALHHIVPGNSDPNIWAYGKSQMGDAFLIPDDLDIIEITHTASK